MSGFNASAADAAAVCLRVMRRLLQDEETTLAQLNYLIENIHEPLAQACLPPSQRPVIPTLPPASPAQNNRASSVSRSVGGSAAARTSSPSFEKDWRGSRRQSPQPAVLAAQGDAKATGASASTGATRHALPAAAAAGRTAKATKTPVPLTFSQYWDLFANLPTLYAVHMMLVQQLEGIIQRLVLMVEELQPLREIADVTPLVDDGAPHHSSGHTTGPASPETHTPGQSSWNTRKHVSALRFPASSAIPTNRGVYGEIGVMMNEFFGSELMKHYMAEHMMYTVKFTQRTSPQLLRLARVWRWTGGAAPGNVSGVSVASLANLSEADRALVLQNGLFLDFLWRSFGRDGVPQDSRVSLPPSLESHVATGQAATPTETANALSPSDAAASLATGGNNTSGPRRPRAPGTAPPTAAGKSALPPIPAMWEGFRTILTLLATPLGELRRFSHVARCIVESGAMQAKDRDRLQESFIDVVATRMSEETNLVMEELWAHDVAGIMALMDMPGTRTPTDKAAVQASPRRGLVGGVVAAAGVVGGVAGGHNGHTVAQDSVAGAGGVVGSVVSAAAASASAAAGLPNVSPADSTNRALIHYGRLSKRFGRGRHERLTFLFSDWMCYVEECSNGRFRVRGTIPLPALRVVEVRDEESSDAMYGFELLSPHLPKRLIFFTASPEQRGQWVDAIRYTVRRFCDQRQPQRGTSPTTTTTSGVSNVGTVAAAATISESGLPNVMRATAPMLSAQSRLNRQRRYDGVWQDYVDMQRRVADTFALTSPVLPGMSSASLGGAVGGGGGGAFGSVSSNGHSPPPQTNLSGDPSRDSSFAGQRSGSTHRQLEYDVTPWSQHASVHRRIRSQELIAAHQQQHHHSTATASSHSASPNNSAATRLNASLSVGPDEVEKTMAMADGSVGDTTTLDAGVSSPSVLTDDAHAATRLPTPLLVASAAGSPAKSFDRRRSSSLRPAFLEAPGSASARVGGSGGIGTPLRRPVSERFEAVKNAGAGLTSPPQPQRPQLRRSSAASAHGSGTALLPPTPGGASPRAGYPAEEEGEVQQPSDAAAESPLPRETGAAERVVLEDSTTEPSPPVEAEEEEEGEEQLESESASDVNGVANEEDGTGTAPQRRTPHRASGMQRLYTDVLQDLTARDADEDDGDIEEEVEEGSGALPSTPGLDRVDDNSPDVLPSEPYDVDLHDGDEGTPPGLTVGDQPSPGTAAAAAAASGLMLLSPLLNDHEGADTHAPSPPSTTTPHNKAAEEDDACTDVVTAFRRHSSPARSVMSPISPIRYAPTQQQNGREEEARRAAEASGASGSSSTVIPGSLLLPGTSTELDVMSPSLAPVTETSLSSQKEEGPGLRSRHVDPAVSGDGAQSQK